MCVFIARCAAFRHIRLSRCVRVVNERNVFSVRTNGIFMRALYETELDGYRRGNERESE